MDASSTRTRAEAVTPPILAWKRYDWNRQFFIRVDRSGVFHTYPELGGPFHSLEEAEEAILRRLDQLWDPKMRTNDGMSRSEIAIRDALYWPDGTKKYTLRSNPDTDHIGLLVQALLDKYNEENVLLGDDAYHLEGVLSFQEVYEGGRGSSYYHLNCTRKTKGGVDNLFFAEVSKMMMRDRLDEFELICLHMVKPDVDNGPCHGCEEDNPGMKHPIDADKYKGGHDPSWPRSCGFYPLGLPMDVDAMIKAREERIINAYKSLDVVKSDAGSAAGLKGKTGKSDVGRTAAGLNGKTGKYIVPALRR